MIPDISRRKFIIGSLGFGSSLVFSGCVTNKKFPAPTTQPTPRSVIGNYNFVSTDGYAGTPLDLGAAAQLFRSPTTRWSVDFDGVRAVTPEIAKRHTSFQISSGESVDGTDIYNIASPLSDGPDTTEVAKVAIGTGETNQNLAVTLWPYNPVTSKDEGPIRAQPAPVGGDKTVSQIFVHRYEGVDEVTFIPGEDVEVFLSDEQGALFPIDPFSEKYVTPNGWEVSINAPKKTFEVSRTVSSDTVSKEPNFPGIAIVANNTVTGETFALTGLAI